MSSIPMDPDLLDRLHQFLSRLQELSVETDIAITFMTGPEYLETSGGDTLPVRINRTNGSYVVEEPFG